jgi:hypothetical protein
MGVFVGLYVAQLVVAFVILVAVPKRDDLPQKVNAGRDNAIKISLVPCVGIMLFYQVCFLGYYYVAKGRVDHKRSQLADRFGATSFDSPKPAVLGSQTPAAPPANPFADPASGGSGGSSSGGPASDNPFL